MSATKKLTLSAVLTALCVVLLYFAAVLPVSQLAVIAAAGLVPAVAVIHAGCWWGLGVYGAAGLLSLLILPTKMAALWFLLVFGHYGILKSLIERVHAVFLTWVLKLGVFSLCIGLMYGLFRGFFLAALPTAHLAVLFGALLLCFVLYDIAFSALISVYNRRVKPHIM